MMLASLGAFPYGSVERLDRGALSQGINIYGTYITIVVVRLVVYQSGTG